MAHEFLDWKMEPGSVSAEQAASVDPGDVNRYLRHAMRFDLLLAELHLFKSRSQAQAAIEEGRARLNGTLVKSSHLARAGDRVTLSLGEHERTLEILDLPRRSTSKKAAREMVREVERP
jgi:ribosomal 50S subunit-recycling heat shock protein